jgi:hypothetical protein
VAKEHNESINADSTVDDRVSAWVGFAL